MKGITADYKKWVSLVVKSLWFCDSQRFEVSPICELTDNTLTTICLMKYSSIMI